MCVWCVCVEGKDVDLGKWVLNRLHFLPKTLHHQGYISKIERSQSAISASVEEKLGLAKEE